MWRETAMEDVMQANVCDIGATIARTVKITVM